MFIQSVYMICLSPILVITYPSLLHLCIYYVIDESLQILLMLPCQALAQSLDLSVVALSKPAGICQFSAILMLSGSHQFFVVKDMLSQPSLRFYSVIACTTGENIRAVIKCRAA